MSNNNDYYYHFNNVTAGNNTWYNEVSNATAQIEKFTEQFERMKNALKNPKIEGFTSLHEIGKENWWKDYA